MKPFTRPGVEFSLFVTEKSTHNNTVIMLANKCISVACTPTNTTMVYDVE